MRFPTIFSIFYIFLDTQCKNNLVIKIIIKKDKNMYIYLSYNVDGGLLFFIAESKILYTKCNLNF